MFGIILFLFLSHIFIYYLIIVRYVKSNRFIELCDWFNNAIQISILIEYRNLCYKNKKPAIWFYIDVLVIVLFFVSLFVWINKN